MTYSPRNLGFTLVEMAIVLVILGLLIGGVLSGRALIRAAELRAVTTEYNKFLGAAIAFKDRYMQLPGDMNNATQFWGRADNGTFTGQCAAPATNQGTGTQTCNGNGNGRVFESGIDATNERFRVWQHLANAGLIEGSYTGVAGAGGVNHHIPGVNSPSSKLSGAGWSTRYQDGVLATDTLNFAGDYGGWILIGGASTNSNPNVAIFTPEEAWSLDSKIDDGKAGRGKVTARTVAVCTLAANAGELDADYNLSLQSKECLLTFRHVF